MRALTTREMLELWESGAALHPGDRRAALVGLVVPEAAHRAPPDQPLGDCDTALWQARRASFGDAATGVVRCPGCGERLEFDISCSRMVDGRRPAATRVEVCEGDFVAEVRAATCADLQAAARCLDVDAAKRVLLERCVVRLSRSGEVAGEIHTLPPTLVQKIADAMIAADGAAETLVVVECPTCRRTSEHVIDISQFLWAEVCDRAIRVLVEVHLLARAYGWSEDDILAMSARRRAAYLHLVTA